MRSDTALLGRLALGVVSSLAACALEPIPAGAIDVTAYGGDSTPHAKPHPAPLLEAARRLNLEPGRCIYVGDDERDVLAGLAAGMATVAATYGYLGGTPALRWGAHAHIDTPLELLALLQSVVKD